MNESVNISNSMVVKEAQELILEFVKDYFDEKVAADVLKVLRKCPVHFVDSKDNNNELGASRPKDGIYDYENVGGYASDEGLFLPNSAASYNKDDEWDRDLKIVLIIHEYAHKLRKINSNYGYMFEEGFATVFAEACIIHSKLKKQAANGQPLEQIGVYSNNSWKYRKAESQVRTIMYVLNQHGLDMKLIGEYIFGNQNVFKQKCVEIFGEEFSTYFDLANSSEDQYFNDYENEEQNSEIMLINLISNYIKQKRLNLSNYWDKNYIVQYNSKAETLCKSVVDAGINSVREEDREAFNLFEYSVKMINQDSKDVINDRIDRIRKVIESKYTLAGKSKEEIYDTIIDLCSEYIQRKNTDIKENQIFIEELKKIIPNLEEFAETIRKLRHFTTTSSFLEEIDISKGVSYQQIFSISSSLLEQYQMKQIVENLKTVFDNCDTKEKLLSAITEINKCKDKVDIEQIFSNYSDFRHFVSELDSQIPDFFDSDIEWNYNTLYSKMLELYIFKKEKNLERSKDMELSYKSLLESIDNQRKVIVFESDFNIINSKNTNLNNSLLNEQQKLENENQIRITNQTKKDNMVSRKNELQGKNVIIRLFKRREIKSLSVQIDIIEKELENNSTKLVDIRNTISSLRSEIKNNEQKLIELCGLNISDYGSILEKCKLENLIQEDLLEQVSRIREQLEGLEISSQEQELSNLYIKNGLIREEKVEIIGVQQRK